MATNTPTIDLLATLSNLSTPDYSVPPTQAAKSVLLRYPLTNDDRAELHTTLNAVEHDTTKTHEHLERHRARGKHRLVARDEERLRNLAALKARLQEAL